MPTIAENLSTITERIAAAARDCGRQPGEVRLLPVSKTKPPSDVLAAVEAGCTRFGENRVQDALAKWELINPDHPRIEWVIIGALQTNKAKYVARFASELQALDSLKVAHELDRRLQREGRQLDVLVEVNSSQEPQKSGIAPEDALGFAKDLAAFDALRVKGLMTVAVHSEDRARVAACFERTRVLRDQLRQDAGEVSCWEELSMGMSGDLDLAVAHGSTQVRVGQAIFGPREGQGWRP